jgi:hypothetical protein
VTLHAANLTADNQPELNRRRPALARKLHAPVDLGPVPWEGAAHRCGPPSDAAPPRRRLRDPAKRTPVVDIHATTTQVALRTPNLTANDRPELNHRRPAPAREPSPRR